MKNKMMLLLSGTTVIMSVVVVILNLISGDDVLWPALTGAWALDSFDNQLKNFKQSN